MPGWDYKFTPTLPHFLPGWDLLEDSDTFSALTWAGTSSNDLTRLHRVFRWGTTDPFWGKSPRILKNLEDFFSIFFKFLWTELGFFHTEVNILMLQFQFVQEVPVWSDVLSVSCRPSSGRLSTLTAMPLIFFNALTQHLPQERAAHHFYMNIFNCTQQHKSVSSL